MWPLGEAFKLMNEKGPQAYKFTVAASGPFGPVPALSYIMDMADSRGLPVLRKPSPADVGSEGLIKKIGEQT